MKTLYTTYNNFAKRLVMSLMVLMTVGVGSVWGETWTWTANAGGDLGSKNGTVTLNGKSWNVSRSSWTQAGTMNNGCIQVGSKKNPTSLTLETDDFAEYTITKIDVVCSSHNGNHNITMLVGSNTFYSTSSTPIGDGSKAAKVSGTGSAAGTITISFTQKSTEWRAMYIKSITVTYEVAATCTTAPTVSAGSHSNVTTNSATVTCSSGLTSLGSAGCSIKSYGFVYGTSSNPTISNTKVQVGTSYTTTSTSFNKSITGLSANTTYYVRPYATNGYGTAYGTQTSFKTKEIKYTVTYNANGATGTVPTDANEYASGATVTVMSHGDLAKIGYSFTGWKRNDNSAIVQENATFTMPASNLTLTAQWTAKALTNYRTTCTEPCEQLGDATGLSVQTDYEEGGQTYVKFSWTPADNTKSHATKQVICIGKVGEEKKCTDLEGNQVWSGDLRSKLTPGEYEWTIQAIGDGATYCDGEVISGPNFTIEEPLTDNCRWVEIPIEDITPEDEIVVTMGDDKTVYALGTETIDPSPKSQAITITSGMIDINQDFDYSQYTWSISAVTGGYQLQPYGTTQYLYGVASYITISTNPTTFSIFTSPENGNKCFMYTIEYTPYYLGHGTEDGQTAWKRVTSSDNLLKSNTLKFYKKTCLPANKFWIDYELANVTCTTDPIPSQIDQTGEDLLLEFSANDGYKLPETISVKMGETEIGNDENYCVWDKETGDLLIVGELITDNITITIEGCERLAAPENLLATNITSTSAVLSWDAVAKADEYIVFVTDGETNLEIPTTNCTITIEGLSKNTYYLWDVTATADNYCDSKKPSVLTNEFTTLDVYTVTFNTDGGTDVAPQTVDHGGKVAKPANPTKTGYKFAGWYTEADTEFDFNTPITSATTLYAKWNANQYTITFLKQYGAGGTDKATVTFNSNNFSVVTIELPTRDGYEFGGYYTETGGAGLQIVDAEGKWLKNKTGYLDASGNWIKAESVNLYAKWTKIHTITWVVNNNTETPHYTSKVLDGNTIDELPNAPADDLFEDCEVNVFVGWSTDNIGLEPDATAPTDLFKTLSEAQSKIGAINGDKKFYAVYAEEIESTTTFKRVHELSELNTSSKIAIINAFNKTKYILPTSLEAKATTPSENLGEITIGDGQYWNIEKDGDNWKFKSGNKYLAGTTIPTNNNKTGALALTESEDNTTWTIVKNTYEENGTPVFTIYNTDNTTAGLEYSNGWILYYATDFNTSWFTLNLYVPRTTYSNYITHCTALPDPVWGGATIDKTEIAVNCGETSSTNGAAKISFRKETNFNLYKDIKVEVTSVNFIIASSRDGEYSTSVTLTPTQSGTNVGTLDGKYVYVRAVAPPMSSNQLTGTITISGKQITTQVINVTATVTCNEYTLTFKDCGDTKKISNFAGTSVEEMEPWAETCSEPFQYVFDGWATAPVTNGTEEYDKVDFSTFTMPNNNTTILYAVYRYAEEGGEPVNGYVKVTEALTDWSGDYVIVEDQKYNEQYKAIKSAYKKDYILSVANVEIVDDEVISPEGDAIWSIRKNSETENYTMYNAATGKYAYIEKDDAKGAGLGTTAKDVVITFNNKIATIKDVNIARCFSYYANDDEWRTYSSSNYNTGYLYRLSNKTIRYTSSLVCGTIEAEDALVTSTKDQKVKVKVPITLESSTGVTTINATSDNAAFDVTGLTDVEAGDHTIVVEYTPAEYNITETANITLSATNGATATFTVSGRSLPENFVIATKVGAIWYALPANMNGATNPEGVVIDVDETTMTATAPNITVYTLFPVATINGNSDRYKEYGERLRFAAVNNGNKGLWANDAKSGTTINNDAKITAANSTAGAAYEWKITTTIVDGNWQYTLQTDQTNNQKYLRYYNSKWGTYANGENDLYFLPVTEVEPFEMQVVEWYPTKVLVQTEATLATVSATIGGEEVAEPVVTQKGGKLYEISNLPLETNPTKLLAISYTTDEITYANNTVIPIIISRAEKNIADEPFATLTADVYNSADLVVRDGAVLTVNGTEKANTFANVTIYPTAKISVPTGEKLSVYSLTFFGGIDEIYDGTNYTINKYGVPQLSLKGTLGKTVTTMDYIMRVDLDQMYSLGVPYDVNLGDITYWDGSEIELGDALYVSAYDGQARANREKKTWIYETDFESKLGAATLKAGVGYTISAEPQVAGDEYSILRMPMKSNISSNSTEGEKTILVTGYANTKGETITDNHKGWNLLSNPYMTAISGDMGEGQLVVGFLQETGTGPWDWVSDSYRYVTIPADNGKDYSQQKFTDADLPPFKNFFVQVGTTGELVFDLGTRQSMPARSTQAAIEKEVEFEILMSNATRQDNTGLLISEGYSPAYEINADLEKMTGSMSVYTIFGGYKLAYNALSPINASEWIPMGYIAPAAGEYTFRLDDVENIAEQVEHVYIIDYNANNIVDLMDEEYKFTTDKEQNDNRFAINVVLSQDKDNTTTGLDIINGNVAAPIKFIYHDKMYIQSGGVIYDGTGKQVTNINK